MRQNTQGYLMILVLFTLTGIAMLTTTGLTRTMTELLAARTYVSNLQSFHQAEATVTQGVVDFREAVLNQRDPETAAACDLTTLPPPAGWQTIPSLGDATHVQEYCTEPYGDKQAVTDPVTGDYSEVRPYRIFARVRIGGSPARTTIVQYVERKFTPVFQYEVLYNDALEIQPGRNMTLTGRVFTNSDLFLYPTRTGVNLRFDSNLLATAGRFYAAPGRTTGNPPGAIYVQQ